MGTVEAAFLPCCIYYCSLFYTRRELALRTSVFFQMGYIAVGERRVFRMLSNNRLIESRVLSAG